VFEAHLQAYIVENIGRNINQSLDESLLLRLPIEWIGNEVYCGVGLQRVDVMLSLIKDNTRIIVPIELKAIEADLTNTIQIQRYVDWLEQYYIPNRISDIQPVLISKKIGNNASSYERIIEDFKNFNNNNKRCFPLKFIEYDLIGNNFVFEQIKY
jgi:RecB family endonuclease NucS